MTNTLVQTKTLQKQFGDKTVINGIDLKVNEGEVYTLLGVNGAGKTTLINMLLGMIKPTAGDISIMGFPPSSNASRKHIGATPQEIGFPVFVKVREVIEFVRQHYPNPASVNDMLERFQLHDIAEQMTRGLSGGQKRRLALALAFVGNPKLVFLDEPTTGLDVESRRQVWQAIQDYVARGSSIFLTTHYLEEAEMLSNRIALIQHGKIETEGTVAEIKAIAGLTTVKLTSAAFNFHSDNVSHIEQHDHHYIIQTKNADELIRELVIANVDFHDLEVTPAKLEDAFIAMTGK